MERLDRNSPGAKMKRVALRGNASAPELGHRPDGRRVRSMFAGIAERYDFLNHALSLGVDRSWRRKTVHRALSLDPALREGGRVLDLCTGTGDLAFAFEDEGCRVVGGDFCEAMLERGLSKRAKRKSEAAFLAADAMRLPFVDRSFDLACVGFGIRNVQNPLEGLREMHRILRPGGIVLVLEFALPKGRVLRPLYSFYFHRILPRIGSFLARSRESAAAYRYLPESVRLFPEREAFLRLMEGAGFTDGAFELLSFGIAALYRGRKPEEG